MRATRASLVSFAVVAALMAAITILLVGCGGGGSGGLPPTVYQLVVFPDTELEPPYVVEEWQRFRLLPSNCGYAVKAGANLVTQESPNVFLALGGGQVVITAIDTRGAEQEIRITINAVVGVFEEKGCTPNPPDTTATKAWSADDSWYVILYPPRQLDIWDTQYQFPVKGFPASTKVLAFAFYRDASTSTSLLATIEQDGIYLRDLWPWGTPTAVRMGNVNGYQYIRIMADGGGLKIVLSTNGGGIEAEIPIP